MTKYLFSCIFKLNAYSKVGNSPAGRRKTPYADMQKVCRDLFLSILYVTASRDKSYQLSISTIFRRFPFHKVLRRKSEPCLLTFLRFDSPFTSLIGLCLTLLNIFVLPAFKREKYNGEQVS